MTPFYLLLGKHRQQQQESREAAGGVSEERRALPQGSAAVREVGSALRPLCAAWCLHSSCRKTGINMLICQGEKNVCGVTLKEQCALCRVGRLASYQSDCNFIFFFFISEPKVTAWR